MGIKHKVNRLFGRSTAENENIKERTEKDVIKNVNITEEVSNRKPEMKNVRQVGSKWEHIHDSYDWHCMSIPHQLPVQVVREMSEPPESATAESSEQPIAKKDIFCKFVVQEREKIGETISLDSGRLVFKNGAERLAIPLSAILDVGDEEVYVGEFNREEALKLGTEWTMRTTDKLTFDKKGMLIND